MWIYQAEASVQPMRAAAQAVPAEKPDAKVPQTADKSGQTILPKSLGKTQPLPHKDCWLLAGAFLLGSTSAGVLQAFCEQHPPDWLQFYLQSWQNLFTVTDAHTAAALFGIEYLTLAVSATILLFLGFSALGPVLIFLFFMLYGLGNGTLLALIFSGLQLQKGLLFLCLILLPSAAAAGGLCLLGSNALQVSTRIRACSFFSAGNMRAVASSAALVRSYLLTMALFLPLCGVSAAFAGIGSRF